MVCRLGCWSNHLDVANAAVDGGQKKRPLPQQGLIVQCVILFLNSHHQHHVNCFHCACVLGAFYDCHSSLIKDFSIIFEWLATSASLYWFVLVFLQLSSCINLILIKTTKIIQNRPPLFIFRLMVPILIRSTLLASVSIWSLVAPVLLL